MAGVTRFEELDVWVRARELVRTVYQQSQSGRFGMDFPLRDQIRKAAISVLSNIAEGFERDGDQEFLQFLAIAKGSCGEVRAQLYVAFDQEYLGENDFRALVELATEVSRLIAGLMRYLRQSSLKGRKYR